jgi:hypothetical protein
MFNEGPKIWAATAELRWVETTRGRQQQQKWIECYPTCVITGHGDNARPLPGCPTGNFEWRDVPTVRADEAT